jgi:hypothetical protein
MLGPRAVPPNDSRFTDRATYGSVGAMGTFGKRIRFLPHQGGAKVGMRQSARAVEAQFDHPGGDLAGAVAAGVAGDFELGGEGV